MGLFTYRVASEVDADEIQSVELMNMVTERVITSYYKLANMQEEEYTTVYSFYVTYKDGTFKLVETSDQDDIAIYLSLVDKRQNEDAGAEEESAKEQSILDDLIKLKKLYDDGVIPESSYNKKRESLLSLLDKEFEENLDNERTGIVHFIRANLFGGIKEPAFVYVDGEYLESQYMDDTAAYNVPFGKHTLRIECRDISTECEFELTGEKQEIYLDYWIEKNYTARIFEE